MPHPFSLPLNRRGMLRSMIAGTTILPGLLSQMLAEDGAAPAVDPLAPRPAQFPPKAKRVIFLFMNGGVSHVDSWDPKPRLFQGAGQSVSVDEWQGRKGDYKMYLTRPLWEFRPYGQCGTEVSALFPQTAQCVDDLCVIRSMRSDHTNHYESTLGMHTGSFTFTRPSIGSWVSYGLGCENRNLPSFVVIAPQTPYAGNQVWGSDFLPGTHQGTLVVPGDEPIANVRRRTATAHLQELELQAMARMNRRHLQTRPDDPLLTARIRSFETAFGMQVKRGIVYGESDDAGIRVARDEVHVHDFHATILHLLGFDHEKLTYRHNGRDYRLTDVSGKVVKGILV